MIVPLPEFIEPMKCKLVARPPAGDWLYEIKFDPEAFTRGELRPLTESGRIQGVRFKTAPVGLGKLGACLNLPYRPLGSINFAVLLCGVSPLVWRRLLVASETSLAELHEILQIAFNWSGEHLHRFLIHGATYGIPHLGGIVFREDARQVPLSRFRLHSGERFRYEYDFTADWKLDIRLEWAMPLD